MGVGESLKEIYYNWEEKWYNFLDKTDEHLPTYKIIDPIDEVFPSFALFLILIFILLLTLTLGLFGFVGVSQATLNLSVVDDNDNPVSGAEIKFSGINETFYTNEYGLIEPVKVPLGREISVSAKKDTVSATVPLLIESEEQNSEIKIKGLSITFAESKVLQILTEQGTRVTDKVTLNFECSSGITPTEITRDIYNGNANIDVMSDCGTMLVTISSEKYETKKTSLIGPTTTVSLALLVPKEIGRAIVNLRGEDGNLISEEVTVQAYRATNTISPEETKIAVNGVATFDLPEGEYKFRTIMEKGYKSSDYSPIKNITKQTPTIIDLNLKKDFVGKINVTTKVGSTLLSGVKITLMKETVEMMSKITTDGVTYFEATEVGPFNVYATKDGYCEEVVTASAPSDINITMRSNTGVCGGKLQAKVIDTDNKPVSFARVIIFAEKDDDEYKTAYIEKLTDYNGVVSWDPIKYTTSGEKYKIFAFKGAYSGWSEAKEFTSITKNQEFVAKLEIPFGKITISIKDNYGAPVTNEDGNPTYVQLFGDYDNAKLTGQRIVEGSEGKIEFEIKAGRKVYAVIKKEGYETYTTIPKLIIGNGVINYNVVLSKPPIEEIQIKSLGLYKNDSKVLTVQAGQEYLALFELIAPKSYEELGFFVRVGRDDQTRTELDNMFIKEIVAPGINTITTGATYNKPRGYSIDEQYLNLEESKWGQAKWTEYNYAVGKIIVGTIIKIKENAKEGNDTISYRAWGVENGSYERDARDEILGTSQTSSAKQELYAATKDQIISIGTESLCEESENNTFCISSTYTDSDGFTNNFESSFDAKNNATYNLNIRVMSRAQITFEKAAIKLENQEENLYLGNYTIIKPREGIINGTINGYETSWIETPNYSPGTSITINPLQLTPRKIGSGELKLRIRDGSKLVLEKIFSIGILSDKKMRVEYMYSNKFQNDLPKLVSGKEQPITVKAFNETTNLEIEGAIVKLYDRFGTKLTESLTNKVGVATINLPASLPAEKLFIKIEKAEYETYVKEFTISEDIVDINPTELSYTLNPQTTTEESKTVKIENKTGFDLTIKEIKLTGKLKGLVSESQTESWLNNYKGTKIKADDYIEAEFKIFIGRVIPQAEDLEGKFEIIVGNEYNEWIKEVNAKIRVGLGKDVDDPNCLEITKTNWKATTQGKEIQLAFDVINNCMVERKLVSLKNLGARNETTNGIGTMSVQSTNGYAELAKSYNRVFQPTIAPGEKIPVVIKFTPFGGVNGTATGTIIFEAENLADSKNQKITTQLEYSIDAINLQECLVLGSNLIKIEPEGTGSFSITNNCPTKADISIKTELQTSNDIFSIEAKGSQEVTITRNLGDIAGAYNILVYARQGNSKEELLGNVKAILDSDGCIELTRYEYDIYDSESNQFDGVDRGYLRNNCTQKNIGVEVSGVEPYDKDRVLKQALIGAIIGYFRSDCDNWFYKLYKGSCDNNKTQLSGKPEQDRLNLFNKSKSEIRDITEALILPTTDPRTPAQVTNEYDEKNTEIQVKLEEQVKNTYIRPGYWEAFTTGAKKLGNEALDGFQALGLNAWIVSIKNWANSSVIPDARTMDQVNTIVADTQDNLKGLIEQQKIKFNDELEKIKTNRDEFNKKIVTAKKEADTKLNTLNKEIQEKTKEGSIDSEKIKEQFSKKMEEINTDIEKAYTEAAKTYNEKTMKNKDNIIKLLEENEKNLKTYNSKLNENVDKKQDAAQQAVDAAQQAVEAAQQEEKHAAQQAVEAAIKAKTAKEKAKELAIKSEELIVITKQVKKLETEHAKMQEKIQEETKTIKYLESAKNNANNDPWKQLYKFRINRHTKELEELKTKMQKITDELEIKQPKLSKSKQAATQADATVKEAQQAATQAAIAAQKAESESNAKSKEATKQAKLAETTLFISIQNVTISKNITDYEIPAIEKLKEEVGTIKLADETYSEENITSKIEGTKIIETETTNVNNASIEQKLRNQYHNGEQIIKLTIQNNFANVEYSVSDGTEKIDTFKIENGIITKLITSPFIAGTFLLATTSPNNDMFSGISNLLTNNTTGIMGGMFSNSALMGGIVSALMEMATAQDTQINYTDTFAVEKVVIDGVELESPDGVGVEMGDVTYDFDSMNTSQNTAGETAGTMSGGITNQQNNQLGQNQTNYQNQQTQNYNSGVLFNPQAMSATQGLTEIRELTFNNPGRKSTKSQYEPFIGVLTVNATENVYQTDYNYEGIKKAAKARGTYKENEGIFDDWLGGIFGDIFKTDTITIAEMDKNDLIVESTRDYTKKFHLIFNSYEYEDTPTTTPPIGNCVTDSGKSGSTGESAAPRMLLAWNWTDIKANTCDEDNENYVYCDTTQFTISTLMKLQEMKDFFKTNSLTQCPQAIDIAGTKTQELAENTLDVAITRTQFKATTDGATLEAIVKSNNQLPMSIKLTFNITMQDGTTVSAPQCEITKEVVSEQIYSCSVTTNEIGSGAFNVVATINPTMCEGCINSVSSNDSLASMLILGSANIQNCQEYSTKTDYFTKVLAANDTLKGDGQKILNYTNFTVNLLRDGFSEDFKQDFDNASRTLINAPAYYNVEGLRELFLSERFVVEWPNRPAPWNPGKYNARIIIEFNEDNWMWSNDNNNINKITVKLEPWGDPEPYHTLYNLGFNGMVGIESDNGRQGYGVNFAQMSESPVYITDTIVARPDPYNNGVTTAIVSVDKSFYSMNNSIRKGNIMTVSRKGDDVELTMSPNTAVPMVLTVTRNQARDAYAYYLAEVDGRSQNELGSTFMQWTGIGQGCYDFSGSGMENMVNSTDEKSETTGQGYGLRWNNAVRAGTVSMYGTMYFPQDSAAVLNITTQSESALLETEFGTGTTIVIQNTEGIKSIKDVIDNVENGKVCVVQGEYFWNSGKVMEPLTSIITGKENSCIKK